MVGVLSVNSELLRSRAQRARNIIARGVYAAPAGQFLYDRVLIIVYAKRMYNLCTAAVQHAYRAAARARARSLAAQKELCM